MRYLTLLLASSIALYGSDNHVAAAAAITVNDPSHVYTFLELKNNTRPQSLRKSNEDDERMLPSPSEKPPQLISEFVARKAAKIMGTEKNLPPASQKSLEVIFEEIRAGAVGPSTIDKVNHVLETMKTEELKRAVEVFKMHNTFLVEKFIKEWSLGAVAKALVDMERSDNPNVVGNGKMLLDNLMEFWDSKFIFYRDVFTHLEIDDGYKKQFLDMKDFDELGVYVKLRPLYNVPKPVENKHLEFLVFKDRLKLLDNFITRYANENDREATLFLTLMDGFGLTYYNDLLTLLDKANANSFYNRIYLHTK